VAFNTFEHWTEDASEDSEIKTRCDIQRRFRSRTTGWILRGRHGICPATQATGWWHLVIPASSNLPWRRSMEKALSGEPCVHEIKFDG
jgi:hypothetical protein